MIKTDFQKIRLFLLIIYSYKISLTLLISLIILNILRKILNQDFAIKSLSEN